MSNVTKAIHNILANTPAIVSLVSTRIWVTRADQKSTAIPRIIITRISNVPESTKDGNNTWTSRIQVSSYAADQKQVSALADLVRVALDRTNSNTMVNGIKIGQIDIMDENDLSADFAGFNGLFHIAQDFKVFYNG